MKINCEKRNVVMINCVNEYDKINRNVVELFIKIRRKNNT